jgi:RNA polymerase sigma-70 factor (ECF subfamily)
VFQVVLKKKPTRGIEARQPKAIAASDIAARTSVGTGGIPYREWSDLDLVASLVDESGDAYAELYRRHSVAVTSAARMVLLRDERCEDVVAEVFVGLWFFPEKFDPSRGSLLSFLRLKARGRSIDLVRAETSRRRREETESRAIVGGVEDSDRPIIASDEALAIRSALAQLPANEREPISLAFFSGMSYRSVAAQLNLPEGTVKSRIRAGLNHLQANGRLQLLHDSTFSEVPTDVPVRDDRA